MAVGSLRAHSCLFLTFSTGTMRVRKTRGVGCALFFFFLLTRRERTNAPLSCLPAGEAKKLKLGLRVCMCVRACDSLSRSISAALFTAQNLPFLANNERVPSRIQQWRTTTGRPVCCALNSFCHFVRGTSFFAPQSARWKMKPAFLKLKMLRSFAHIQPFSNAMQRRIQRNVSTWPNEEMKNVEKRVDHDDDDDDGPRQCVNWKELYTRLYSQMSGRALSGFGPIRRNKQQPWENPKTKVWAKSCTKWLNLLQKR